MSKKKTKKVRVFIDEEGKHTTPEKGVMMEEFEYDENGNVIGISIYFSNDKYPLEK